MIEAGLFVRHGFEFPPTHQRRSKSNSMKANHSPKFALWMLSLVIAMPAYAEVASTVVVADDQSRYQTTSQQETASASGSLVFVEQTQPEASAPESDPFERKLDAMGSSASLPRQGRGDLLVVPNVRRKRTAGSSQAAVAKQQPKKPTRHGKAVQPANWESTVVSDQTDHVAELLVWAHELSQRASTEADYSEIIAMCSEAVRSGVQADRREFTRQLLSWSLNRRGQLRADAGNQEIALADFEESLSYEPNHWRALHNRGVSYAQAGKFEEALNDFNRVIEINSEYAKAYSNRATLRMQSGEAEAALTDYRRASKIDDQLVSSWIGRGRACHMLGFWEESLKCFDTVVEMNPENADFICSRGDLLADMGRYREALADYAQTIEINPEFAHAYRNGAWLLATCPDPRFRDEENAVRGARRALEFGYGERHVALDTLAAAQASAGKFEEAVQTLEEAIAEAPEDVKYGYQARLEMYQVEHPFRTEPVDDVSQVVYEVSDQ